MFLLAGSFIHGLTSFPFCQREFALVELHVSHKQQVHCMRLSLEIFPPNTSLCLSPEASQLHPAAMGKNILFPWNTEEREEKHSCGTGAEEWSPEIPGHFTPAPMRVEVWLQFHTGATTVCTKFPRVSCCLGAGVWGDQAATLSEQKMTSHACFCG